MQTLIFKIDYISEQYVNGKFALLMFLYNVNKKVKIHRYVYYQHLYYAGIYTFQLYIVFDIFHSIQLDMH